MMNLTSLYTESENFKTLLCKDEEEWLKERSNGIGGSDASSLVNMNPWKDANTLWKEKKRIIVPKDISKKKEVVFGKKSEEYIRNIFALEYEDMYETQYIDNAILVSKEHDFMRYSPDGLLLDKSSGMKGILEIKTTNIMSSSQREKWNNRIPDNYYIQVLHGLLVTDYDFIILKARLISEWDGEVTVTIKHYPIFKKDVEEDLKWLKEQELNAYNKYYIGNIEPPMILKI